MVLSDHNCTLVLAAQRALLLPLQLRLVLHFLLWSICHSSALRGTCAVLWCSTQTWVKCLFTAGEASRGILWCSFCWKGLKCYICPRGAFITEVEQEALYFFLFKSRRALTCVNSRGQQRLVKVWNKASTPLSQRFPPRAAKHCCIYTCLPAEGADG